jgi:hypothetical protein
VFDLPGDTAENIAGAIAFLLPGFLAISTFEAFSPSVARNRSVWSWTMWSLTVSLLMLAAANGLYKELDWPRKPTDPQFYGPLFGIALVGGYVLGRASGTLAAGEVAKKLKILQPRWIWFEVVSAPERYVIVHLIDGTVLYGYPKKYTDDSREETREMLLTNVCLLVQGENGERDRWEPYPNTEGILIESPQVKFVQLLTEERPTD